MYLKYRVSVLLIFISGLAFGQRNYCWFGYKPALSQDSLLLSEYSKIEILQLKDSSVIDTITLNDCITSVLDGVFIKKEKVKKGKIIHVLEEKYTVNTFKLIHVIKGGGQIKKTKNKLKKGDFSEDFAFSKIRYFYKDGLLVKLNFYLVEFKYNNQDFISLYFNYLE